MRSLVVLLAGALIAQAPSLHPKPYGNLKQVMRSVALPNSDIIFGVQGKLPKNDMEWQAVVNAAVAIEELENLIMIPGRIRSNGQPVPVQNADYAKFAAALAPAGRDCLKASLKKTTMPSAIAPTVSARPAITATKFIGTPRKSRPCDVKAVVTDCDRAGLASDPRVMLVSS